MGCTDGDMNVDTCLVRTLGRVCSEKRQKHAHEVARLAAHLCTRFGLRPRKGHIAGLAHDIGREMNDRDVIRLASHDGRRLSEWELARPVLLHGRASAVMLMQECRVFDSDILDAVREHVMGRAGMSALARIVFVADYLEPSRGILKQRIREELLAGDLDAMVVRVLEYTFEYLRGRGRAIACPSLGLYKELKGDGGEIREKAEEILSH